MMHIPGKKDILGQEIVSFFICMRKLFFFLQLLSAEKENKWLMRDLECIRATITHKKVNNPSTTVTVSSWGSANQLNREKATFCIITFITQINHSRLNFSRNWIQFLSLELHKPIVSNGPFSPPRFFSVPPFIPDENCVCVAF